MKNLMARTLTTLTLAMVAFATAGLASAQSTSNKLVKVHIPFEFNFGDKTFPAGDYTLAEPMQNLLVLRDSNNRAVAQVLTVNHELPAGFADAKVRFDSTNGEFTMTEVLRGNEMAGQQLYPVK
jgi:hypothetical protein